MIREKKHISNPQTVLSLAVLIILIIICAGVIIAQYSYNPAVLQKDALLSTVEKSANPLPQLPKNSFCRCRKAWCP